MGPRVSVRIRPSARFAGRLRVPGDKSIAHRYALLAAMTDGPSTISQFAPGADAAATLSCLEALGTPIRRHSATLIIIGRGPRGFSSPERPLDARNSGTTARLLAGILAAQSFRAVVDGDDSLRRRPMTRVVAPLARMGARIATTNGRLPMTIDGGLLAGIDFEPGVPSAQVKSAVLLAGLQANGSTRVTETHATRNHTELALGLFGARVDVRGLSVSIDGRQALSPADATVPGDLSSAVFWMAAAAAVPDGDVTIEGVGLNRTRRSVLDKLRQAGADVEETVEVVAGGEPAGTVRVRNRGLSPIVVAPSEVPALIDELPALAAMATHGGEITVTGASELRVKESDRIAALVAGLRGLGADADEMPDGFHISGRLRLSGGLADAAGDHRLAMAFAIAAIGATGPSRIDGADAVEISYPGFFEILDSLTA